MIRNRYHVSAIAAAMAALLPIAALLSAEAGKDRSKGKDRPAPGTTVRPVHGNGNGNGEELPLDEVQLYFALTDPEGDLGIRGLIDGDAWMFLKIEDPNERAILRVLATVRMRQRGMTESFFESDEPPNDELSPEEFFEHFPEGTYEIEGYPGLCMSPSAANADLPAGRRLAAPAGRSRVGPPATYCPSTTRRPRPASGRPSRHLRVFARRLNGPGYPRPSRGLRFLRQAPFPRADSSTAPGDPPSSPPVLPGACAEPRAIPPTAALAAAA